MKRIFFIFMCFFSMASFACPSAPTNDSNFCKSFKAAAQCHCVLRGLPPAVCNNLNMDFLYDLMTGTFGSLAAACTKQFDVPPQVCADAWLCYRQGGVDSLGRPCSSTGLPCPR